MTKWIVGGLVVAGVGYYLWANGYLGGLFKTIAPKPQVSS